MDIALIDPGSKKLTDPMPHIGLAYLSSSLQKAGHTSTILDMEILTEEEVETLMQSKFDAIGITATSFTYRDAMKIIKDIKKLSPQTPIILGGPHVTIALQEVLEYEEIDFAVYGEGEDTILELIRCIEEGRQVYDNSYDKIYGLIFKKNDKVVVNPSRPWNKEPDNLFFPDYQSLPMARYNCYPLITSRGCPYKCTFCAAHILCGGMWRPRSPENIVGEIRYLLNKYGYKKFAVCDDNFNVQVERVKKFCQLLLDSNTNIEWSCWSFRADRTEPAMLKAMKDSGCTAVAIGVESANAQVLKNIKKHETLEQIEEGIRNIKRAGIKCNTLNMIGNQGDNLITVKETIAFNRRMGVNDATFFLALPYPKTELWDYVKNNGKFLKHDYTQFHHFADEPIFETDYFTKEQRTKAYRIARRFTLKNQIRVSIRNKIKTILAWDLKDIGLENVKRFIKYITKIISDLVFGRKQQV